jgi:hypothetical protein
MTGTGANEMRTHRLPAAQRRGEFQDGSLGIDPRNVPKVKTRDFR